MQTTTESAVSTKLQELLKTPFENRDLDWEDQFFMEFTNAKVEVLSADPQTGPDGWPYLLVKISDKGTEPVQRIIQWLGDKGIGLVVNPENSYPDFVFPWGMLWHFCETGLFYRRQAQKINGVVSVESEEAKFMGPPSDKFLPATARKILKDFFRDQAILAPKVFIVGRDELNFDLVFSLESLGNPKPEDHQTFAEAISWFLPPHYSIMLVSEKGLPAFVAL